MTVYRWMTSVAEVVYLLPLDPGYVHVGSDPYLLIEALVLYSEWHVMKPGEVRKFSSTTINPYEPLSTSS